MPRRAALGHDVPRRVELGVLIDALVFQEREHERKAFDLAPLRNDERNRPPAAVVTRDRADSKPGAPRRARRSRLELADLGDGDALADRDELARELAERSESLAQDRDPLMNRPERELNGGHDDVG